MLYQARNDNTKSFAFFFEIDSPVAVGQTLDIPDMGTGEILTEEIGGEGFRMTLTFCPGHKDLYTVIEVCPVKVKIKNT